MRIRELFVASLLTMTFGCPGDDTGDTEANTTVNATDNTTPGTTGDDTTTTDDPPPGTSSGEPPGTSSGEPPGTSSGEPPADSSSSGGGSGSSSGGMGNEACDQFCSDYFAVCGDSEANDYGNMGGCVDTCSGYDQKTFECKEYHASMADGPDSVHCSHANVDGGGVC
jgi:hypothetical protein